MKIAIWYIGVIFTCILLILSIISNNFFITLLSLILALILKRYIHYIPLPKYFNNMKVLHKDEK